MINRCCRILQRQKLVFGGMVCFLTCKHHFEKWKFSSKLLVLEANFSFETSLYQKFKNTCIPLVKIPHPTPDKVQRCLRQRWLFNTYWLPVPPGGGEEVEELNWIKETITDRKRQILLVGLGFEGYCTQQSVSWTGEWQCQGMTSIPLHWLTTLHKLFDLSQSYQHPWDLWEFLPIIQ